MQASNISPNDNNSNHEDSLNIPALKRRTVQEEAASPSSMELDPDHITPIGQGEEQAPLGQQTAPKAQHQPISEEPEIQINIIIRAAPRQTSKCVLVHRKERPTWPQTKAPSAAWYDISLLKNLIFQEVFTWMVVKGIQKQH